MYGNKRVLAISLVILLFFFSFFSVSFTDVTDKTVYIKHLNDARISWSEIFEARRLRNREHIGGEIMESVKLTPIAAYIRLLVPPFIYIPPPSRHSRGMENSKKEEEERKTDSARFFPRANFS